MLDDTKREAAVSSVNPSFFSKFLRLFSPKLKPKMPAMPTGNCKHKLEGLFRYFDEDGDGRISPAELRKGTRDVLSAEEADDAVAYVDSDGDGLLEFDDFARLVEVEEESEEGRSLRDAFGAYEMDGRNCITADSLRRALGRLGERRSAEECETMIRRFDVDGDGVISFDEFRMMMML